MPLLEAGPAGCKLATPDIQHLHILCKKYRNITPQVCYPDMLHNNAKDTRPNVWHLNTLCHDARVKRPRA